MALLMERPIELHTRLVDYLDDKLQTAADLQSLDDLIDSVRAQHELLKTQLADAERSLERAGHAHTNHMLAIERRAQQFAQDQDDIDRRLAAITQSETSDDAYHVFRPIMHNLQSFDVAERYVAMVKEVDELSDACLSQLGRSDEHALDAYHRLQAFHTRLLPLQAAADGATPFLLDHIGNATRTLHDSIRSAFSAQMESVLRDAGWPSEDAAIPPSLQTQWTDSVGKLLELQRAELEAKDGADEALRKAGNSSGRVVGGSGGPVVLLPLQILVKPLELKFRYHFDGDRPTNRLDRPEYFLQFISEDVLGAYNAFVVDHIQPLLLRHFKGTDLSMNPVYIDATSAFITAVMPMVRSKVYALLPRVASQPQLLSHTIYELKRFDTLIRDVWAYDGGYGVEGWKGLAWEVLVLKDWFPRWLQVEKDFALARYQSIINDPASFTLDYEGFAANQTVPTHAAIRLNDLLETITDRYRDLHSFSQKLRFLIDIQLSIFDRFHSRLRDALEAYLSKRSVVAGVVGAGGTREERNKMAGVEGLETLCRVYGSAEYLEKAMRDWSDDVFFLDLYAELPDRARNRGNGTTLAGNMSVAQVAQRTSASVTADADDDVAVEDGGALFDETAAAYQRLRVRSEQMIAEVLQQGVRESMRGYRSINPWASLSSSSSAPAAASPTPELSPLLDFAATSLAFLRRALGTAALRRVCRLMLAAVHDMIFDQLLLKRNFSTLGAAQLGVDVGAVVYVFERAAGGMEGDAGLESVVGAALGKLLEGVRLVSLPVKGKGKGWAADVDADAEDGGEGEGEGSGRSAALGLGLWQVEKRLFADNESARRVLEDLGMERLSKSDARHVLERRVELGG